MTTQVEETTAHDDLTAVLADAYDQSEGITPSEEPTEAAARGPDGRFAPREASEDDVEPGATPEATQELQETSWEDRPPSSWKPSVREAWATLPEPVRKEILRREEANVIGVRQLQEKMGPYSALAEGVRPYMGDIAGKGGNPIEYTKQLLEIDRQMRYATTPQEKFHVLARMANAYGVPLQQMLGGEMPATPAPQSSVPPQILQELQELKQWRQESVYNNAVHEVETFGENLEFFSDVRLQMADLIEAGAAKSKEQAYEMACWADPEVREVLLQRERGQAGQSQFQARQRAAAGASLPVGNGVSVPMDEDGGDDIGSILRSEFTRQAAGRV